ncbi:adenylate cyclase [Rhizobium sp. SIMBA_035]
MTASTRGDVPCDDDILAQLERVMASPEFPGGSRAATFLRYVVGETLSGRSGRIKGYSIAIEVFGRDDTFTQEDPVVRMEAGRLRRLLERYYLVSGKNDPVRIDVPKGGYVPAFSWNTEASDVIEIAPAAVLPLPPSGPWWLTKRTACALVAAALAVFGAVATGGLTFRSPDLVGGDPFLDRPSLVVAPFANLGDGPTAQLYTVGLTEELLTALPRFKEIKVFGRETSKLLAPDVDASTVRDKLGARYILAGGVRASGSQLRVTARLVDTTDGEIVWSQDYDNDLGSRDLFAIQSDVARRVATTIAQPYGVMAQVEASNPPPNDLGTYECTLRFYGYRAELSAEAHAGVRTCLESAVARHPTYATAWAMLSIIYLDEDRFRFNPQPRQDSPLQRALRAAKRSTQLDPSNTRGLQALMMALYFDRRPDEGFRVGEQALATNPNDTELMGEFGARLALSGRWQRGADMLDQAIRLNPGGGGFYHGTRALAAYMLHDDKTALREIELADMQKFPLYHAVAAVIYGEVGRMDDAHRATAEFVRMRPDFPAHIVEELSTRNVQPSDTVRLIAGLRRAGMQIPLGVTGDSGILVSR